MEKEIERLHELAKGGDADAMYKLSAIYWYGEGIPENKDEAIKWLQQAAEKGHIEAQLQLAICYFSGVGVPKDKVEATKRYRDIAIQGESYAQYLLGKYCLEGGEVYNNASGAPYSEDGALEWLYRAAEEGVAAAQHALGVYYEGIKDRIGAAAWFRKAEARGIARQKKEGK